MALEIDKLIKEAHENAINKGFYDCPNPSHKKEDYQGYCCTCGGQNKDPNANIGEKFMLIVSEVGEALESHRKGRFCNVSMLARNPFEKIGHSQWIHDFENFIKDTFEDEVADVFIRLFDLCGYMNKSLEIDKLNIWIKETDNVGDQLLHIVKYVSNENIYCSFNAMLQFSEKLNIPIEKHIKAKMAYNKTRPRLHGKKY